MIQIIPEQGNAVTMVKNKTCSCNYRNKQQDQLDHADTSYAQHSSEDHIDDHQRDRDRHGYDQADIWENDFNDRRCCDQL